MNKIGIKTFLIFTSSFIFSCTVSIDGAPCDPEQNNCPSGQYCSSEGICKRGSPEIKDVVEAGDYIGIRDNEDLDVNDIIVDLGDVYSDIVEDISRDVSEDVGCNNECSITICKDNKILLVCKDWDNDGCVEFNEVECGSGSECKNNICVCVPPYQDCNLDMSDGCETNIKTDPKKCGSCSNNCGDNSKCSDGVCLCEDGFGNCDGIWSNGCETDLNNVNTCGTDCLNIKNCGQNTECIGHVCVCKADYKDCNKNPDDGCETNIKNNIKNCGGCNVECKPQNVGNPICNEGNCDYDTCIEYFIDKDEDKTNGCEYWSNFPKRYDNTQQNDEPALLLYDDEGLLIGGNTGNNRLWLVKVDKYGEIMWQKMVQLKGIAKLKKGLSVLNNTGNIEGFFLTGTLQNSDRIDIFIIRLKKNGDILFSKSYSMKPPLINKFDILGIKQIIGKDLYVLVGQSDKTPLFVSLKEGGDVYAARYYEDVSGSNNLSMGYFTDVEILPVYDDVVYLTGVYEVVTNSGIKKEIIVGKFSFDGGIKQFHCISSQLDIVGLALNPFVGVISGEQFYVFGESGTKGLNLKAIALKYDFGSKTIDKSVIFTAQDSSGGSAGISFRTAQIINKNGFFNLVGGLFYFMENMSYMSRALVALLDQNLNVSVMKSIGDTNTEEIIDLLVDKATFIISPIRYNYNLDYLVVKLNNDVMIEGASCKKSFIYDVKFIGNSLINVNVDGVNVKDTSFSLLVQDDIVMSQTPTNSEAYNVCSKP